MLRTLAAFLCFCFAVPAPAKLGETVPQLVKRFGKTYAVEAVELGKKYKFRSEKVSLDAIVASGVSICETYLSDHPLTASGEPPNDIVRGVLRTNVPKARWVEINAAPFGADYALRSSDDKYIAILHYTGAQPENNIWRMTVGFANSVRTLSSISPPSANPSPSPPSVLAPSLSPSPSPFALATPTPDIDFSPSTALPFEDIKAKAETGDPESEYQLGARYYNGDGVGKDVVEAVKWFRRAAEQNYALAQFSLGDCYAKGRGVTKDVAEAVKWYRKAAEQNLAGAQNMLGRAYWHGQGVTKDEAEAVKWFRKAAEQNHAWAEFSLGFCYASGRGVPKDEGEALRWYRKAAERNLPQAQFNLGSCYYNGQGVAKNYAEAVNWFHKAAEQNHAVAQSNLGFLYANGQGVHKNYVEAVKWYRKAADQNDAVAQSELGDCYLFGRGVQKNYVEAVKWYRKAAEQNDAVAQCNLGVRYYYGEGVAKDYVEAYKWGLLAAARGNEYAKGWLVASLEDQMSREQVAEGQRLARNFTPRRLPPAGSNISDTAILQTRPESSGSGFFITDDGFLVTNEHVVKDAAQIRLVTGTGLIEARVVKMDSANDLALLKAEGKFTPLPVATSRTVHLGSTVATIGFPNIGLQGFAPKFARGEIGSLSGPQDDARYFQISVPVQPGNSGGALVDEHGNAVGVVSAALSVKAALATSGSLPQSVNYAVKSSFVLGFLEAVPEVAAKLKEPNTKDMKFDDVVDQAKEAAVLVLVY